MDGTKIRQLVALTVVALVGGVGCNDSQLAPAPLSTDEPIAVIDGAQTYSPLDTGVFDGTGSHDPDGGDLVSFDWEITARPAGSTAAIQYVDDQHVEFFVDLAGDYEITLTVTDDEGDTGSTSFEFSAIPSQSLHIELTWDTYTQTDIDLHMTNKSAGGDYAHPLYDCYYANCKVDDFSGDLDWGVQGQAADNPTLDIDNISESVPENINIITPSNGTYEVMVHYFSNSGMVPSSTWTVRVFLSGDLVFEKTRAFTTVDQLWHVAEIDWNGGQGTVNELDTVSTAF